MHSVNLVLRELKKHANPRNVAGMARFGISSKNTLGISIPILRKMAKQIGIDHALALKLWSTGIHEARILAAMVDEPEKVTPKQMDAWVKDFDSWDVCDQVCMNLFDKTPFAFSKAKAWARRTKEFEKRAGFAMMAVLAWHDKTAKDSAFVSFFPLIKKAATDERNYVKKAVNWAIRQIGKRNSLLRKRCVALCKKIQRIDSKVARWIAGDALREFSRLNH